MAIDFALFHFIRPNWLLALPVVLLLWLMIRRVARTSQWEEFIPKEMIAALQLNKAGRSGLWQWGLLGLWLSLVLAAAGPTWNKQAVPTVENQQALVIALDLSPSMLAEDLTPNRLTRAKYKLIDILRAQEDGQVALIAYAGDAHTVSPLTDDPRNIEALLPALHPAIMPSPGSNTEAAVTLAQQLLSAAGASSGTILLISDGVTAEAADYIRSQVNPAHTVSILGVGGSEGAPIPAAQGGFLRNSRGEIILAALNSAELQSLAGSLGGRYATLSADDSDVTRLLAADDVDVNPLDILDAVSFDAWTDRGYLLVLLALPFALLFFRKGLVYVLPLFFIVPIDTDAAEAESAGLRWADLWQTPDQQGAQLMNEEQFGEAAKTFKNRDWSAVASYRDGDYAGTIKQLNGRNDLRSLYNKANAQAFNGDIEGALESYDDVLKRQPDHADAAHNKAVLEKLMQEGQDQSDQQQSDQQQSDQQQSDQQQSDQQQSDQQQSDQQQSDQQQSDQQQSDQQQSDQQQSDQQQSDQQQSDQQQSDQQQSDQQQESEEQQEQEQQASPDQQDTEPTEEPGDEQSGLGYQADPEPLEESSEQWLRAIPDDPSGLLRRKFQHQAEQRAHQRSGRPSATNNDERY